MAEKWTTLATIAKTHERCVAEGIGVSRNLIRQLVLSGEIPSVVVGKNTRLIHWGRLMDYLYQGTPQVEEVVPRGAIRRIEVL